LAICREENSARPPARAAVDGDAFLVEDFDQPLQQLHEPGGGRNAQHRRHEIGIVGEVAGAVADHARDGHGEQVARRFRVQQQAQVLAAQLHGALVGAGVLVVQHARLGGVARVARFAVRQRAVEAVRLARRDGQHHHDAVARGREQVGDDARLRQRIALRHVKRQTVAQHAARMN